MEAAATTTETPKTDTQVTTLPVRRPTEVRVVSDPIAVLDTARFEHMQRIANVMAQSNLIPASLCQIKEGNAMVELPLPRIIANCFLVVNQAVRWGMDPFAVAQCVSVIHGKLCYEGKLIAAVIEAKLGIRLRYEWSGQGDDMKIVVSGKYPDEAEARTVEGTVADWKTTASGTPWVPKQYKKMLAYRGAREWGRLHSPGLMLGVYSDDELSDMAEDARANRARDITETARLERPKAPDPNAFTEVAEQAQPAEPQPQPETKPTRPQAPNPNAAAPPPVTDTDEIPAHLRRKEDGGFENPGLGQSAQSKQVQQERQDLLGTLLAEIASTPEKELGVWSVNNAARLTTLTEAQREQISQAISFRLG